MDFNRRQSTMGGIRSTQKGGPPSSVKQRQQQQIQVPEHLAFLLLEPPAISECITELGFPLSIDDIEKPNPNKICQLFEQILEEHTGISYMNTTPILNAISGQLEYPETMGDSLKFVTVFRAVRSLLSVCQVNDFTVNDLLNPKPQRLVRFLSFLINFSRFRTEKKPDIEKLAVESEDIKQRVEDLFARNDELQHTLETLRIQRKQEEPLVKTLNEENMQTVEVLRELKRKQTKACTDLENLKNTKKDTKSKLKESKVILVNVNQECSKIRPYIMDSPEKLQQVNVDLNATLASDKAKLLADERRIRGLKTSAESYNVIGQDIASCLEVMEKCEAELLEEERENKKLTRINESLRNKTGEVQKMEKTEEGLKSRLTSALEKVEYIRGTAMEKNQGAHEKMKELNEKYDSLARERDEKNDSLNEKKMKIERFEKRILDEKERFEDEVRETHAEFAKLDTHISYYMTEMCKTMTVDPISV